MVRELLGPQGDDKEMTLSHISKVTPLQARLLCHCRDHPQVHQEGAGVGTEYIQKRSALSPCHRAQPSLDTPASGPNVSSDLHSPSGVINHALPPLPLPSNGDQQHGHFLKSCLLNGNLLFQFWHQLPEKLALPLKKVGQWHESMISQVLTGVARAKLILVLLGPGGPACQFSNI